MAFVPVVPVPDDVLAAASESYMRSMVHERVFPNASTLYFEDEADRIAKAARRVHEFARRALSGYADGDYLRNYLRTYARWYNSGTEAERNAHEQTMRAYIAMIIGPELSALEGAQPSMEY